MPQIFYRKVLKLTLSFFSVIAVTGTAKAAENADELIALQRQVIQLQSEVASLRNQHASFSITTDSLDCSYLAARISQFTSSNDGKLSFSCKEADPQDMARRHYVGTISVIH